MNIYEMVTNRIIKELEHGVIPWEKPWTGVRSGAFNRISKHPYSILNQMLLYRPGEYATYKQWQSLGGKIKKGEKAQFVVFWKMLQMEEENENGGKTKKIIPYLKYINVFHIDQVEGVEPLKQPFKEVKSIDEADEIINDYVEREGIKFNAIASNEAYYSPLNDMVVVPLKEQYNDIEEYYSTTFHELVHSTGHATRLNRLTSGVNAAFGSEVYSKEELIAEIGTAAMLNYLGIETKKTFRNSTAYIQSWLQVLKNDNKFVVSAGGKAEKAVDFILGEKSAYDSSQLLS